MAESRKLQQTGGSTLIVSLPKKWINKNKLKAGSEVRLRKQSDGTMNIDPGKSDTTKKPQSCSVTMKKVNIYSEI